MLSGTVPEIAGYGEFVEIGSGGYSRVYRARQYEFERPVAIKVLNDPLKDRAAVAAFERECRTMGALWDHPNIVPVFASAFTSDNRPCIVMKLFHEGSYFQVLRKSGPVALEELLLVGANIAGALAAAHETGVVHGDVKPHNVFKSKFGEPALGDFGIATFVGRQNDGTPRGLSVHYAAPESVEEGPSPAADQYSLAATLYTMALAKRPFESPDTGSSDSRNQVQILLRVLEAPTPRLPDRFPPDLSDAICRAMARDPDQRFEDVGAFGVALADIGLGLGSTTAERAGKSAPKQQPPVDSAMGLEHDTASRSDGPQTTSDVTMGEKERDRRVVTGSVGSRERATAACEPSERPADDPPSAAGPSNGVLAARTVEARLCLDCQSAHPPSATVCLRCGIDLDDSTSRIQSVLQPCLGIVRLSDGRVETLDADLVVGRNPAPEPLESHERAVVASEGDRTVSRRQVELRLNGWELSALLLGKNTRLLRRGRLSPLDTGTAIGLTVGDVLYFGAASWLHYTSNHQSVGIHNSTTAAHSHHGDPRVGTVHFSGGRIEALDSDLVVGRNPSRQPLEIHQRAIVHGGSDRTISRGHLELRWRDDQLIVTCIGSNISLQRGVLFRELQSGDTETLEHSDILHYGTSSWLRFEDLDS